MSDDKRTQTGLSLRTLLIAGAASATAAFVIPMVWRPGTVFAAAMTPIVVALVTELLHRPVETVSTAAVRRARREAPVLDRTDEPFDPLAPPSAEELETLPRTESSKPAVHRRPLTGRQWKLGIATGLAAFAIVAAVFTATELVAGDSISTGGGRTTFFSGSRSDNKQTQDKKDQEKSPEKDEQSPTPTPEASATPTPTPTPTATPMPEATAPPTTTPAPAEPAPTP